MDRIQNIVIFKPIEYDSSQQDVNYKVLAVQHQNGDSFLRFELKEDEIDSFDMSGARQSLSLKSEPLTVTTTLSLRNNNEVVAIQARSATTPRFVSWKLSWISVLPYSTCPICSENVEGLDLYFEPLHSSKDSSEIRYEIIDEQDGINLGILVLPGGCNGVPSSEVTLTFGENATPTQKQIIVGMVALIISDLFQTQHQLLSRSKKYVFAVLVFSIILLVVLLVIQKDFESPFYVNLD